MRCVATVLAACAWFASVAGAGDVRAGDPALPVRALADAARTDVPGPDVTGFLGVVVESSVSGVRVTRVVPGSPAEEAGLRAGDLLRSVGGVELARSDDLDAALDDRRPGDTVSIAATRGGTALARSVRLRARRVLDSTFRGSVFRLAVVPLLFADDRGAPPDPAAVRRLLLDRTGRVGAGASLADYYDHESWGRLRVEGDVLAPVTLGLARAAYADHPMGGQVGSAYQDAAAALRARVGDSGLADYDGITFVYAGAAESRPGRALWPHRSAVRIGARRMPYYVQADSGDDGAKIGVHCHEFGHLIGLPDTYGAGHRTGSGDFCLMSIGHRGGPRAGAASPFSLCAHCRLRMGWLQPVAVDPRRTQRLRIPPVSAGAANAVLVALDPRCAEYLLLENRARTGFDAEIPSDGLLVWHAGGRASAGQSVYTMPVDLIEAHGVDVFDASLVRIDEIAFPTARARELGPDTTPALRPSQPISFPCALTDIVREPDGSIVVTIGAPRPLRQAPPAPYAIETPDADGYVVRRDPVTGESLRFYVGPRAAAPEPPRPAGEGQQNR